MLNISIDRNDDKPAYTQIVEQIVRAICDGKLKVGDRLPSERELATELNLARGTVKKAYDKLTSDHIIQSSRGSGTFVSPEQDVLTSSRKENAVKKIEKLIKELESADFSEREIGALFQVLLAERRRKKQLLNIAAVDCNPEALTVFERQLQHAGNVKVHKFLLNQVLADADELEKLAEFDLILTTATHYDELRAAQAPQVRSRILQAVLSPGRETIVELAQLNPAGKVGIVCRSTNFCNIIKRHLKYFELKNSNIMCAVGDGSKKADLIAILQNCDAIVAPPKSSELLNRELEEYFNTFAERGGKVVRFDYQIERGALTYIEEKISQLSIERGI